MLKQFENYLIQSGYKEFSAQGSKSTVFDYSFRIGLLCKREGISEQQLAEHINEYVKLYSKNGEKWNISKRSHQSYWNALRNFRKFVLIQRFGPIAG